MFYGNRFTLYILFIFVYFTLIQLTNFVADIKQNITDTKSPCYYDQYNSYDLTEKLRMHQYMNYI